MVDFVPVEKPSSLVNGNNTSNKSNFSAVDKPSKLKFDKIMEATADTVGDAGRLIKTGVSSAIATLPSLPESLLNLGSLGSNFVGKKLGLIPEDKKAKYFDIPFLPSFDEAQTAISAPSGQIKYLEGLLTPAKTQEIQMGLLNQNINPNSPEFKKAYLTQLEIANGKKPSLEMQTPVGQFLKTPAEYYGMGKVFGTTSGRISGGAGVLESSLKLTPMADGTATGIALGTDVALSLIAGVRNPNHITKLNNSIKSYVKNGKIDEAKELLKFAEKYNIPLLGIEALAQVTKDASLIKLAKLTSQNTDGKGFKFLNGREVKLNESANQFLKDTFGKNNFRYLDVSQNMVDKLKGAQTALKKRISLKARQRGYKEFDSYEFGSEATNVVANLLAELSTGSSLTTSKSKQFLKFSQEIKGKDQKALQQLSQDLGLDITKFKSASQSDPTMVRQLLEVKSYVDLTLKEINGYARASKTFERLSKRLLAPFDEAITVNDKLKLEIKATEGLLEKVLLGNVDNVSVSRLFKELNKIDTKIAPEVAQALFYDVFSKIEISPSMGKNMFKKVYGNPAQQRRVNAILTGVAKAQGKDPAMVIKGFKTMLETFNATSKLSGGESITTLSNKLSTDMGLPNVKFNPLEIFDNIVANNNWDGLAKIITSQNSLDTMVNLSRTTNKKQANILVGNLFRMNEKMDNTKTYEEQE
tara:strand:+ start:73 stop:2166 length:2094 start_codon:yes stop_codon:yes gene_type:complete